MQQNRIYLSINEMPEVWYNILPDLPAGMPMPLNPATKQVIAPEALAAIFPMELIKQEMSPERFIPIPDEVRSIYGQSRPTPLIRAYGLERALDTPARIYYKYEGVNPSGSHKTNTAIPQAYYNKQAGIRKLVTETGAGQWGSSLAYACGLFGMECEVFMVKVSFSQKPYRKSFMQLFGAVVHASPSMLTHAGRNVLAEDPDSPGSLGIAISEAIEIAAGNPDVNYSLGSVLNHVLLHQTIIGEEARLQMEKAGEYPDVVIGCVGGGSNFAGLAFSFLRDKLSGKNPGLNVVAVEPASCPTLTKGRYEYDFGDQAGMTPLMKMHTLGHQFIPAKIHAGGLRYHGVSPVISHLYEHKAVTAEAYLQNEVFEAARIFAKAEGIVPAPESSHAIRSAVNHALHCKETREAKTILFNLSGHGFLDLGAYDAFLSGSLDDHELTAAEIKANFDRYSKSVA